MCRIQVWRGVLRMAPLANGGSGFRPAPDAGTGFPMFLMTSPIMSGMEGGDGLRRNGIDQPHGDGHSGCAQIGRQCGDQSGPTGPPDRPLPEIDIVERARMILKKYAGPAASMMVDDVLDDLYPQYPSGIEGGICLRRCRPREWPARRFPFRTAGLIPIHDRLEKLSLSFQFIVCC